MSHTDALTAHNSLANSAATSYSVCLDLELQYFSRSQRQLYITAVGTVLCEVVTRDSTSLTLYFLFNLLPYPEVQPTRFPSAFFAGLLAIFILLGVMKQPWISPKTIITIHIRRLELKQILDIYS